MAGRPVKAAPPVPSRMTVYVGVSTGDAVGVCMCCATMLLRQGGKDYGQAAGGATRGARAVRRREVTGIQSCQFTRNEPCSPGTSTS